MYWQLRISTSFVTFRHQRTQAVVSNFFSLHALAARQHHMTADSRARTTKRRVISRCASAIQIVRPRESTPETQPQLQSALVRLSATISQYFTHTMPDNLSGIVRESRA